MRTSDSRPARTLRIVDKSYDDAEEERAYWLSRPAEDRVAAVSYLTEQCWVFQGLMELPHLKRAVSFRVLRS